MRKLVAALACRNKGSRLYGKPLQNLDIENGISILDNIVACLKQIPVIDSIVLGIADGIENDVFVEYAQANDISYIRGDEEDVLERLIRCGDLEGATDIFRSTSESPFLYFDLIDEAWTQHVESNNDATFLDDIIDGCGFEILSLDALKISHNEGEDRHRSELCTLYIRENKNQFKLGYIDPPEKLARKDMRLTVDYPEDLVVCRAVYEHFKSFEPNIPLLDVVDFLDRNPQLLSLTSPFCEEGYKTMYL
ncbi:acylneuraminate cytidylyltransferase [bacterium]|nr:acylneuraminate cytidylyltransferase [bacterium]